MSSIVPSIAIRDLSVSLGGRNVLDKINLDIPSATITAIIGPNGAGKTTLLKAILGLVPYSGTIAFGENGSHRPRIGYVPQSMEIERENPIRVADFLVLTSRIAPLWFGMGRSEIARIDSALDRVGAMHLASRPIGKLSGGEMQRVLLAKVVAEDREIVLLDEPVSGIDVSGEKVFCELIEEIQAEKRFTLVLVSHDLSVVARHARNVVCLNRQVLCAAEPLVALSPENIARLFGPSQLVTHSDTHTHDDHAARN
ncbi:MAG: metal ABC transporter ATP-binding protein [Candidatus Brocadiia bacterium]